MFVLPARAAELVRTTMNVSGALSMTRIGTDDLYVVTGYRASGSNDTLPTHPGSRQAALINGETGYEARWQRVPPEIHVRWRQLMLRPALSLQFSALRDICHQAGMAMTAGPRLLVTYCPEAAGFPPEYGIPDLVAWRVPDESVRPAHLQIEPAAYGLGQLAGHWPIERLATCSVLVIGTGSIGGAAALALAAYGTGCIGLLDHDRLLWHNTVRHVLGDDQVGRFKVDGLADVIRGKRPEIAVEPYVLNAVEGASRLRGLLPRYDAVLCAADGIAPRRVVSHLARRAGVPAVLACVLDGGAVGEVLRLRPNPRAGCLLCQRQALVDAGGIDPEPALDAPYGEGNRHRPMTAVGSDLALVGGLAAKMAVATLLQAAGEHDQKMPDDHAVIGLRPRPGLAPPYDLKRAGGIRWSPVPPPRPGCPTCSPP
jgi:hypothetical protein